MNRKPPQYNPGQWRNGTAVHQEDRILAHTDPDAREQSRLFDLLGNINYKILTGNRIYVEVGGVRYRTLYGGYWRSVFTGIQHFLLRCEQIPNPMWNDDDDKSSVVDLPIAYSTEGWTASGQSLSFVLNRDTLLGRHLNSASAPSRLASITQTLRLRLRKRDVLRWFPSSQKESEQQDQSLHPDS